MTQEIGESREAWGRDVVKMAEDFAINMKHEDRPFYIVYACKQDATHLGAFRQTIKAYYARPPAIIGILVWYVDNKEGKFEFIPELSAPPDIPLDEKLLSTDSADSFADISNKAGKLNVLVS